MSEFIELVKNGKVKQALEIFNGVGESEKDLRVIFYNEVLNNLNFCTIELFEGLSSFINEKMAGAAIPIAISSGNLEIVKFLYGKAPNRELDIEMFFAMNECADKSRFQVLLYLYDIYGEKALSPHVIYEIIKQDNIKLFELLEDKFPAIKQNCQAHLTFAVKNVSLNLAEYFISQGAQVDGVCQYLVFLAQVEDPKIVFNPKFKTMIEKFNKEENNE